MTQRRDLLVAAALAGSFAVPAMADGHALPELNWRLATSVPPTIEFYEGAVTFAEEVERMTDGKFKIRVFAGGELVPAFGVFDAVSDGTVEMGHTASYYYFGKNEAYALDTTVPFGMNYRQFQAWWNYGNGKTLIQDLFAEANIVPFPAGNTGVQMGGWFRKEIKSADDLKGLKIRMPGLGGDVMSKLGASPVSLPGGQIYENLVSGAIDATEWVGPWNDQIMKLYEAAKFYYYPGMHEPGAMLSIGMNKKWWDGLSKADQLLIEAAASMENDVMLSEYNAKNGSALKALVNEQGVKLRAFSDDVYDSFGEAADEVFEDVKKHSALAKEIHESFVAARADIGAWAKISDQAYVSQRNRVLGL